MDLPTNNVELVPEKETIEDGKEGCPAFHCDLYDIEIVYKITHVFLQGLAAACVDSTTGGIFRSPASVAVDLRKEMIDYLTQRSESFVAESLILEDGTEVSDHPYDIISDFVDDFSSSKRNFFSRVSGWLLSEKREDKIDDFVQEMEENGFWLTDRREVIAQTLVKNVDFKNTFHCDKKFNKTEELAEHVVNCDFRSMNCKNEGCTVVFCARHMENHDSVCPFKIIPCEQKCSDSIMRREMDRHCITVCPMKLVNCPFYAIGCQSTIPRSMIQQHCSDDLHFHLLYALKNIHKGAAEEDLKHRVDQILQSSSSQLKAARDARSLTLRVRDLDAKLGPLEVSTAKKVSEDSTEATNNITDKSTDTVNKAIEESSEDGNGGIEKSINTINKISEESSEAANYITDKSTEAANNMTDKSTSAANKAIEESSEDGNGGVEKSINTINKIGEESSEAANYITDKSTEAANNMTDKSTDAINKAIEESSEAGNGGVEKTTNMTKKVGEKSTEAANNITYKSSEAIKKENEESSEAGNYVTEKSTNTTNKVGEEYTEAAKSITDKSTETLNKAIEESSEAGNDVIQNSTNSTNNVGEEATETSNLTSHASEEAKSQI
ncbi:hypothetical protein P3X46_009383 [Hevea brasiliensis]|uniref:TRAF-type domain-containing protein n=1 Tax=Hevea brasiliensis TaxID=3981 RepID=A0ABQ9MLN8_HEVBR|nr:uncharacterized protein LOC110650511 [Hevea brasiliensis]KAJ9181232.1 hypothetical protein P3X46_009383 [Hevea brasiliensis]